MNTNNMECVPELEKVNKDTVKSLSDWYRSIIEDAMKVTEEQIQEFKTKYVKRDHIKIFDQQEPGEQMMMVSLNNLSDDELTGKSKAMDDIRSKSKKDYNSAGFEKIKDTLTVLKLFTERQF